jgi:hypothetical protein
MTFVRIWRTRLDLTRLHDYDRFVEERSRPMFNSQRGFLGVLFSRRDDEVAVLSFSRDLNAVAALETSPNYQDAVRRISDAGFLVGEPRLDVYEVHGGSIENVPDLLPPD